MLGGTGQVGNSSTDMSLADAQKIADRAIQVREQACRVRASAECSCMDVECYRQGVVVKALQEFGVCVNDNGCCCSWRHACQGTACQAA